MRIYEKVREFFGAFRGAYFKLPTYNSLSEQCTQQVNENLKLSGQVERFKQRAESLSHQYKTEVAKAEQLALKNQELTSIMTNLSRELGGLEESVGGLTEQRNLLAEEFATAQAQISQYQQGVLESPEYIGLATEKAALEAKVGDLEKEVKNLDDLCRRRHKTISELRIKVREYDRIKIEQIESVYEQRAENPDKGHSYIIIGEHSRIVTSTPEFRKDFNYNDSNKPIKGLHYFKVLKIPEDSPDYISQKQIKELLKDPKEIKLTTTIIDGKSEEKIIRFIKHKPESFQVGVHNYFYTRVDIYEIGIVKREFGKILRKLHIIDGPPKTIAEFLKQHAITDVETETEQKKNEILSRETKKSKPRSSWFGRRTKKPDNPPKTT